MRARAGRLVVESLEARLLFAVELTTYHGDLGSTGQNLAETVLTTSTVSITSFGKLWSTDDAGMNKLDGQVYAQPLYKSNVNITRGSATGVHNVLYVATQHDSLYALDADTGSVLWQDSFLNITNPTNLTPTSGVTPIGANSTINDVVNTADVNPEIGILSTPVIDPGTNILYLNASTKEFRGADRHFVQRLWAVNLSDGSAALGGPVIIGDTLKNSSITSTSTRYTNYQYFAGPIVNGTGNNGGANLNADGWDPSTDPAHLNYKPSASGQIAFNALLQMNRPAITLVDGNLYLGFASHGDDGPYYGWLLAYRAADLSLVGVFNTEPTYKGIVGDRADYTAQGGIWMSANRISSDGTDLYVTTGNGAFDEADSNFDPNGFPIDHNYADCVLKIGLDPDSTQASQNGNGWGLKVVDYFTPSNQLKLNQIDADLGSGGVTVLPDSAGISGHPHLLITGGKEGRIYLIDRDNMGKFNLTYPKNNTSAPYTDPRLYDRVLGEYQGNATNSQTHKDYGTPAYFNGKFYIALSTDPGWTFNVSTFAAGTVPPGTFVPSVSQTTSFTYGSRGPTQTVSASGDTNGIVWGLSNNVSGVTDDLQAYSATNYISPLFDTNTNGPRDSLVGSVAGTKGVKFSVPTVISGMVYCGTGGINSSDSTDGLGGIVAYGVLNSYLTSFPSFFGAPTNLAATKTPAGSVRLQWARQSTLETQFRVERSTNGKTWSVIGFVPNGRGAYLDAVVSSNTTYYYRVAAISGPSITGYSNVASTKAQSTIGAPPHVPGPLIEPAQINRVASYSSVESAWHASWETGNTITAWGREDRPLIA